MIEFMKKRKGYEYRTVDEPIPEAISFNGQKWKTKETDILRYIPKHAMADEIFSLIAGNEKENNFVPSKGYKAGKRDAEFDMTYFS